MPRTVSQDAEQGKLRKVRNHRIVRVHVDLAEDSWAEQEPGDEEQHSGGKHGPVRERRQQHSDKKCHRERENTDHVLRVGKRGVANENDTKST